MNIKNFHEARFIFDSTPSPSFLDFSYLYELEIKQLNTGNELIQLIEILRQAPNLRKLCFRRLRIESSKINERMQKLMAAAQNLEELRFNLYQNFSATFSSDALNTIKREGKNLRKLYINVDQCSVAEMQQKIRNFHRSNIRCYITAGEIYRFPYNTYYVNLHYDSHQGSTFAGWSKAKIFLKFDKKKCWDWFKILCILLIKWNHVWNFNKKYFYNFPLKTWPKIAKLFSSTSGLHLYFVKSVTPSSASISSSMKNFPLHFFGFLSKIA